MVLGEAIADLQQTVREWTRENVHPTSVEEAEQLALEISHVLGQTVAEESIGELAGEASYEGSSRPCGCGRKSKFIDYRKRDLGTLCGVVAVKRAYYWCGHCKTGAIPWDAQHGLTDRLWTPGAKATVAEVVARLPYGEATELLGRLTPLRVEESSAEYIAGEVGERVRDSEGDRIDRYLSGLVELPTERAPERLYVAMDGSKAHIDGSWGEVKTGAIYEAAEGADGVDTSGPKRYVSAHEPAQRFGERLYMAAAECGVAQAAEVVLIGDGAEWIWNLAEHHYPGATQIVDYWHACQHIHDLAKVCYGEGSLQGQRWARDHCQRLQEKGPAPLLRALKRRKPKTSEEAEAIREERGYFTNNQQRMQYPQFRQRGLMIGSGPVEAACKVVVGHRLKRAGMRWKHPGADAILALRCLVLNRQYDDIRRFARAAA